MKQQQQEQQHEKYECETEKVDETTRMEKRG